MTKTPEIIPTGDYIAFTFGDKATQFIRRLLDAEQRIVRTRKMKNHEWIIEQISKGYQDVVITIDDSSKIIVAFCLNDEDLHLPALEQLYEQVMGGA